MTLHSIRVSLFFLLDELTGGERAQCMFASYGPSSPSKNFPRSEHDLSSIFLSGGASCK